MFLISFWPYPLHSYDWSGHFAKITFVNDTPLHVLLLTFFLTTQKNIQTIFSISLIASSNSSVTADSANMEDSKTGLHSYVY